MKKMNLHGSWTLTQADTGETIPSIVPGDIYSAHLAAGRIPDPYIGMNEKDVQWVADKEWIYRKEFMVDQDMFNEKSIFFNIEGLDTVAAITLNGTVVAETDNMFRRYRFEVKHLCATVKNQLEIRLKPVMPEIRARRAGLPFPIPPDVDTEKQKHLNLVRKVQCHGGWDWGICLMVSGIYGECFIGACSSARIEYVYTSQRHTAGDCEVDVTIEAYSPAGGTVPLDIRLGDARACDTVELSAGLNTVTRTVIVRDVKRWWPAGQGEQHLYDMQVSLGDDRLERKIGLRSLEIVNEPDMDGKGRSLSVRVNGRDIFCKGANWIPLDALPQRHTRDRYEKLLNAARDANMNMLRVWGGGQYESSCFYELCDSLGILLWHDLMFACSQYPSTDWFLENVREEIRHQVKRLRDHACIALWCGDNEIIGSLNWYAESKANRDRYLINYDRLNHGVIERAVRESDPGRMFWPSSPSGGPADFSDNWHDDNKGDMHFWSMWFERKPMSVFYSVSPRFCTEFGFQSFPSLDTIRGFAPPAMHNPTSPMMEWRQRSGNGNTMMIEALCANFRFPFSFEDLIYISQIQQAVAMKTAVEYWRTLRPRCMGSLYWQINDEWPAISWSSIEYSGQWKLLHYFARRFFAPAMAAAVQKDSRLVELWVVSDEPEAFEGTLTARIIDFSGTMLNQHCRTVNLKEPSALKIDTLNLENLGAAPESCFLHLRLERNGICAENTHFFSLYKNCELSAATITVSAAAADSGALQVRLETDAPAFFVRLEARGIPGHFSDNGLTLLPGEPAVINFTPEHFVDIKKFTSSLNVRHLRQTYA